MHLRKKNMYAQTQRYAKEHPEIRYYDDDDTAVDDAVDDDDDGIGLYDHIDLSTRVSL